MTVKHKPVMVWITGAWPPDIMGPAIGIIDRALWFDAHSDFELTILVPERPGAPVETYGVKRVETYASKEWPIADLFRAPTIRGGRYIAQRIKELKPDIILHGDLERVYLLTSWSIPGRYWARLHKVPYLGYFHTDYIGFASANPIWKNFLPVVKFMLWHCYHRLDATLAPSITARTKALESRANNVISIPFDGVNTQVFRPENKNPAVIAKIIGTQPAGPVILSFSRISPEKNIDLIIAAVDHLRKTEKYANVTLIIAGNGEKRYEDQLRKRISQSHKSELTHFVGAIRGKDRVELIATVDALALACPHETFGITVTECMASHTPVVCVDKGAPATYLSDGVNGFIARDNDAAHFAGQLAAALECDRHSIGVAAREKVAKIFSMDTICSNLNDYFHAVIHDPSYVPPLPENNPIINPLA